MPNLDDLLRKVPKSQHDYLYSVYEAHINCASKILEKANVVKEHRIPSFAVKYAYSKMRYFVRTHYH